MNKLKDKSLLIVEDDIALRKQLLLFLRPELALVDEASTINEATGLLKQNHYHLLLLDLGLPPAENTPDQGLRLLTRLSGQYKVIVLTGQDDETAVRQAIKHGAFDYLVKPVPSETLLQSLQRAALFLDTEQTLQKKEGLHKITLNFSEENGLQQARETIEKKVLEKVLEDTGFNVYQTARRLGLKRQSVYYFIKKFNLERKDK